MEFLGPTASIVLAPPNTQLLGLAVGTLGLFPPPSGFPPVKQVLVDLCYQSGGAGPVNPFSTDVSYGIAGLQPLVFAAAARKTLPPGTYTVGYCAANILDGDLNNNGAINGWVMATP